MSSSSLPRHHFRILQRGRLPLRPNRRIEPRTEHRCTSALVWPAGQDPSPDNALLTDPCFTDQGFAEAQQAANELGIDLSDVQRVFLTHGHHDHLLWFPAPVRWPTVETLSDPETQGCQGMTIVPCPGHSEDSCSLVFLDERGRSVWVAGDAVLDRDWLLAWGYFWPNLYGPAEIVQTWQSVARVLQADVILPGHGEAIEVTSEVLGLLRERFALAEYAERCPEIPALLERRLAEHRPGPA